MPRSQSKDYTALRQVLDIGEQLAVQGQLLIRPGLPEIIEVREWVCDQVVAQAAGEPPTPWLGTAQSHYEAINRRAQSAVPQWDTILVSESDRGVVAADDANRIVAISASLAAALGWDVDDLVGRRVATLIPPSFGRPTSPASVATCTPGRRTRSAYHWSCRFYTTTAPGCSARSWLSRLRRTPGARSMLPGSSRSPEG
jgi:PAS domain-containing protein